MSERTRLPERRACETFDLVFGGHIFTVNVEDRPGAPREVFVQTNKVGTPLDASIRDAAVLVSIALQCGAPVETLRKAMTRNPDGSPSSAIGAVLDAIVRKARHSEAT